MDLQSERQELKDAWRALASGEERQDGWRIIRLSSCVDGRLRAGRHYPDNTEALLLGFDGIARPEAKSLPQSRGFDVCPLELDGAGGRVWIALRRRADASLELFTHIAEDLVLALNRSTAQTETSLLNGCLCRIRAWQDFMERGGPDVLSPEAELGLYGELTILRSLLEAGLQIGYAVEHWCGPEHGLRDFCLGNGALEVKTGLAIHGFPAHVLSLEQLDDLECQPLIVAAVRLTLQKAGFSLPFLLAQLREVLEEDPEALNSFESKLIRVGYLDRFSGRYQRCFAVQQVRFFVVDKDFPRLTLHSVPNAVTHATYIIDLDRIAGPTLAPLDEVLKLLGVF